MAAASSSLLLPKWGARRRLESSQSPPPENEVDDDGAAEKQQLAKKERKKERRRNTRRITFYGGSRKEGVNGGREGIQQSGLKERQENMLRITLRYFCQGFKVLSLDLNNFWISLSRGIFQIPPHLFLLS